MNFEQELRQVAKRYEEEGYKVVLRPSSTQLPPFVADSEVDSLADEGRPERDRGGPAQQEMPFGKREIIPARRHHKRTAWMAV